MNVIEEVIRRIAYYVNLLTLSSTNYLTAIFQYLNVLRHREGVVKDKYIKRFSPIGSVLINNGQRWKNRFFNYRIFQLHLTIKLSK